ncbi:deoxyhypusine synthase [Candidatus Nitrosocosmicus franklandus]|uniref:Putative deoxyhypusine synthase n=1 Tax=Candidatus Nitrosocosmicus franklandianus TaxID=1798806 RepID=A0A484I7H8_9ARCH|nr:deoxyhypusine synthase [Candidatus Nitrosocosmicus franklandus]VFJ13699.1 putative deoxyhypusine synthase [Candidatus Nitrosocosmicus franklandus]
MNYIKRKERHRKNNNNDLKENNINSNSKRKIKNNDAIVKHSSDLEYLSKTVSDYSINRNTSLKQILSGMADSGGFEGRHLAYGIEILKKMIEEKNCTRFLSFVGALVSTGNRGIIRDMIKNRMFDCVITTCGALDHDIAKSFSSYYEGDFRLNDQFLLEKEIHRLGNILIPNNNYGPLIETKIQPILQEFYNINKSRLQSQSQSLGLAPSEILRFIGSHLNESSFLYWATKNDIPVIVPGIVDGAVGNQIWLFNQSHKDFKVDVLRDQTILSEMIFDAKMTGAFMMGGGLSKHHTLWWNQYRGGLDYAVYITTASEWDGSLSGAPVAEAISWGKVTTQAKQVTIHADVSTVLPFIYYGLVSK